MLDKRAKGCQVTTKAIVRPRYALGVRCAHVPRLRPGFMKCVEDGTPFWDKEHTLPGDPQVARLHHYFLRDQTFVQTKRKRTGHGVKSDRWWKAQDATYSAMTDTAIHRFVPELHRRMGLSGAFSKPRERKRLAS
jgi:hypothetical protein